MNQIEYNGEKIQYNLIKAKIKNIYIKISKGNVIVKEREIEQEDINRLEQIVNECVKKYKQKLKVEPNKIRIKDINYAWGSCSSNKNITINLKLATKPKEVIEYVVLHEMCHLIYMNHSKEFWSLVENNMNEYKKYKKKLSK